MATTATISEVKAFGAKSHTVSWTLAAGETGDAVEFPGSITKSVQFTGTFGGATVVLEGANVSGTYATLTDGDGNSISKSSAALETVYENTRYVRPKVTGGDGTTAIVITMLVRRTG
jgi:hypothetical protein